MRSIWLSKIYAAASLLLRSRLAAVIAISINLIAISTPALLAQPVPPINYREPWTPAPSIEFPFQAFPWVSDPDIPYDWQNATVDIRDAINRCDKAKFWRVIDDQFPWLKDYAQGHKSPQVEPPESGPGATPLQWLQQKLQRALYFLDICDWYKVGDYIFLYPSERLLNSSQIDRFFDPIDKKPKDPKEAAFLLTEANNAVILCNKEAYQNAIDKLKKIGNDMNHEADDLINNPNPPDALGGLAYVLRIEGNTYLKIAEDLEKAREERFRIQGLSAQKTRKARWFSGATQASPVRKQRGAVRKRIIQSGWLLQLCGSNGMHRIPGGIYGRG